MIRDVIRSKIVPQLREAFGKFSGDLMAEHAKDIQHDPANDPRNKSGSSTPIPAPKAGTTPQQATKPVEVKHTKGHVVNTTSISETYEFNTSAEQLYQTFVDQQRTAAFTRAPPSPFEPKEGGKFSLFGGNVDGVFKTLEKDKKIVQDWRLSDWPQGKRLSALIGAHKLILMLLLQATTPPSLSSLTKAPTLQISA